MLVVDDEPDMRFLLRMTLSIGGYEVMEAAHGGEALERMEGSRPDLVVTDLMMPAMSGRELISRLRADSGTRDIPIIQVSGNPDPEAAADAVFTKPVGRDELLEAAGRLIEEVQSGG